MVKTVPAEIIAAAVAILSAYVPGLTPATLQTALENYNIANAASSKDTRPQKPFTRKETAEMLGVSVPTVDRYMASGLLNRVRYSARTVRISADSVYNLMKGEAQGVSHKIQLDTLKAICDATDYSMVTLLSDLGYISPPTADIPPNTVLVVKKNEQRAVYSLTEEDAALVEKTIKALKGDRTRNG